MEEPRAHVDEVAVELDASPVSSYASRTTPVTKSSPGLTPPPGGRQMSGGNGCLRISASCSPLRMKSVTSWIRAGSYVAIAYSRSLISPSHSRIAGSP